MFFTFNFRQPSVLHMSSIMTTTAFQVNYKILLAEEEPVRRIRSQTNKNHVAKEMEISH